MSNKITWVEPDTPHIPLGWYVIINDIYGTAYESYEDYLEDYNKLLDSDVINVNPDL
jgi:hypothetical protein